MTERYVGGYNHVTGEGNRREIISHGFLRPGLGLVVLLCQDVDDLVAGAARDVLLLVPLFVALYVVSCYCCLNIRNCSNLFPVPAVPYSPNEWNEHRGRLTVNFKLSGGEINHFKK